MSDFTGTHDEQELRARVENLEGALLSAVDDLANAGADLAATANARRAVGVWRH